MCYKTVVVCWTRSTADPFSTLMRLLCSSRFKYFAVNCVNFDVDSGIVSQSLNLYQNLIYSNTIEVKNRHSKWFDQIKLNITCINLRTTKSQLSLFFTGTSKQIKFAAQRPTSSTLSVVSWNFLVCLVLDVQAKMV
jgi:hypothetical protein